MMAKRAMGESNPFSVRVAHEIDRVIGVSGLSTVEVLKRAGMSRNYYYLRLRGERPFNTNDVSVLADVIGVDPLEILQRAARTSNVVPLRKTTSLTEDEALELGAVAKKEVIDVDESDL